MNTPLISSSELAALHQRVLERKTRQAIATTFTPGQHRSHYRGQGVELDDTRPYHYGDDIRHMDWRATARSGKATMKVFREERQRQLHIVIDKTSTMAFGTRTTFKACAAAKAAAILIFSALNQHETTAGTLIDENVHHFAATRALNRAFDFINALAAPLPDHTASLWYHFEIEPLLNQLAQQTHPGHTVVFISDFIGFDQEHHSLIRQLAHKRQLIAIRVTDPAEENIPDIGKIKLYSPISQRHHAVDTRDAHVRQTFTKEMQLKHHTLQNFFSACNIPLHRLSTQHDVFNQLEHVW